MPFKHIVSILSFQQRHYDGFADPLKLVGVNVEDGPPKWPESKTDPGPIVYSYMWATPPPLAHTPYASASSSRTMNDRL